MVAKITLEVFAVAKIVIQGTSSAYWTWNVPVLGLAMVALIFLANFQSTMVVVGLETTFTVGVNDRLMTNFASVVILTFKNVVVGFENFSLSTLADNFLESMLAFLAGDVKAHEVGILGFMEHRLALFYRTVKKIKPCVAILALNELAKFGLCQKDLLYRVLAAWTFVESPIDFATIFVADVGGEGFSGFD